MQEVAAEETSLVTAKEAADILGVSKRTVERMQADRILIPVYLPTPRRAKLRRFRRADIEARRTDAIQRSA